MSGVNGFKRRERVPADLVAEAAEAVGTQQPTHLRRLTVDLRIEAQAADESYLSPLVADALREYLDTPAGRGDSTPQSDAMAGKFESRAGLDVTWHATNEYFENGQRVHIGDVLDRARPVPLMVAQLEHHVGFGDCLVIEGVRYSLGAFKVLANPDPAKRYSFVRQGDTVTVVERP